MGAKDYQRLGARGHRGSDISATTVPLFEFPNCMVGTAGPLSDLSRSTNVHTVDEPIISVVRITIAGLCSCSR